MAETQILVVEDEVIVAEDIRRSLQNHGYAVTSTASSGEDAIRKAKEHKPDLTLMDIVLQGKMDGIETAREIRTLFDIPVVYLTAYSDKNTLDRAKITEPYGYIIKPFKERELSIAIEMALFKHKVEKELKDSKEWFNTTLKSINDAVIATDSRGFVKFMNPVAQSLTGWGLDEARGNLLIDIFDILSEKNDRVPQDIAARVTDTGAVINGYQTMLTGKTGIKIPIDISRAPIRDEKGDIIGAVMVFRDITGQKKDEEIRLEKERLDYASRAKTEFIANMSHELRTPLNAIIGFSELLKQKRHGELADKQMHYVDNVIMSSKHLLFLINDILDLSKIEAGKMELVFDHVSVPVVVDEAIVLLKEKARKHNVHLKKELDPQLDYIYADRQRVKQILFNLLSNAVKFSKREGGVVTVKVKKEGDMAGFSVSDTGVGIREEDMDKLFKNFQQLDSGSSRSYEGTGLGLAISKKLVEMHRGTIKAESKYGEGSTFTFLLPIGTGKKDEIHPPGGMFC